MNGCRNPEGVLDQFNGFDAQAGMSGVVCSSCTGNVGKTFIIYFWVKKDMQWGVLLRKENTGIGTCSPR